MRGYPYKNNLVDIQEEVRRYNIERRSPSLVSVSFARKGKRTSGRPAKDSDEKEKKKIVSYFNPWMEKN
jgi:hypothetical protein